jgi:hypothetical protein
MAAAMSGGRRVSGASQVYAFGLAAHAAASYCVAIASPMPAWCGVRPSTRQAPARAVSEGQPHQTSILPPALQPTGSACVPHALARTCDQVLHRRLHHDARVDDHQVWRAAQELTALVPVAVWCVCVCVWFGWCVRVVPRAGERPHGPRRQERRRRGTPPARPAPQHDSLAAVGVHDGHGQAGRVR